MQPSFVLSYPKKAFHILNGKMTCFQHQKKQFSPLYLVIFLMFYVLLTKQNRLVVVLVFKIFVVRIRGDFLCMTILVNLQEINVGSLTKFFILIMELLQEFQLHCFLFFYFETIIKKKNEKTEISEVVSFHLYSLTQKQLKILCHFYVKY